VKVFQQINTLIKKTKITTKPSSKPREDWQVYPNYGFSVSDIEVVLMLTVFLADKYKKKTKRHNRIIIKVQGKFAGIIQIKVFLSHIKVVFLMKVLRHINTKYRVGLDLSRHNNKACQSLETTGRYFSKFMVSVRDRLY
jgi:hypothetical protein